MIEGIKHTGLVLALSLFSAAVVAGDHGHASGEACEGFSPQTPRDIDN